MGILSFHPVKNMYTQNMTGLVATTYDVADIMNNAMEFKLYVLLNSDMCVKGGAARGTMPAFVISVVSVTVLFISSPPHIG